jgi:hypothetical protein
MTDDAFARQFQSAATEIVRMYSTAFTVMEIEMGSGPALALAPHFLGDVVAAAERMAITQLQTEAEAKALAEEEQAVQQQRRQLTIEEALAGAGEPW